MINNMIRQKLKTDRQCVYSEASVHMESEAQCGLLMVTQMVGVQ